ncbi:16S rRNA (cytidine(1402)-2'-O)-methyltransferase [Helicobacter sp. MIT 00-7814]|uniref:16S rRNA (cytidine(1402)-2'-O)-methyltransferase n=1 Tax=unclassified Helicobacter TaxID=2593540 RepID=UPI000E1FAE0D|nr:MULTISPECIES: 16S rRNA (cytidine(1402)-2'-O)-methyltransferase [unclassified Helicobacter]RDU56356.1 16S rRNA (cytidine(1402)-2'-O)-methyltransferase [Helicobacter sp. MIT 99-10781]RDU56439.1 16S rRNA (cytidine(1402)-2'-O)-methyltransferase [Helicobacter sp. MIT 00-7814]
MLSLVPTPIGNLHDITLRALERLFEAEVILCEDTRVGKKLYMLLQERGLFKILSNTQSLSVQTTNSQTQQNRRFLSFHSHNQQEFLATLSQDFFTQKVVYVSDAGMPCISDPGALLVNYCIRHNIEYDILPGASALSVAFASSGIESSNFYFGGFLPHKKNERKRILSFYARLEIPCIWYESPHRLFDTLQDIQEILPNAYICACKELSKLHQKHYFGNASEILKILQNSKIYGEWVLCVQNSAHYESVEKFLQSFQGFNERADSQKNIEHLSPQNGISVEDILALELSPKAKAKLLSKLTQKPIKLCYEEILQSSASKTAQAHAQDSKQKKSHKGAR